MHVFLFNHVQGKSSLIQVKVVREILISNTVIGRKVQCELCSASVLQRWLGGLNSEGLVRDVKHYETQERALVHEKSIWIFKLGLIQVLLSHRGCRRGPIFRCWLRGTINSFGRLEFSQANSLSRRAWVILGMWPWTIRNYVSVYSILYRSRLRPNWEKGSEELD